MTNTYNYKYYCVFIICHYDKSHYLYLYSKSTGHAQKDVDPAFPLGPYVKGKTLPPNPFNDKSGVIVDIATTDITARPLVAGDDAYGYKFFTKTGVIVACDGGTSGTVAHVDY